jgi:hypothetical protein
VFGMQAPRVPASISPPAPTSGARLRGATTPPPMRQPTERTGDPTNVRGEEPSEENLSVGDDTVPRIEPMWPPTEPVPTLKQAPPPPLRSGGGGLNATGAPPSGMMTKTISVPPPPPGLRPIGSNPPPFEASRPPVMPEGSPSPMLPHGGPPTPTHVGPPPPPPPHGSPPPPPMYAPPPMAAPLPPPFPIGGTPSVRPRWITIALIVAIVALLGGIAAVAGFLIHRSLTETNAGGTIASATPIDAAQAIALPTDDAAPRLTTPDAEPAVVAAIDAAEAVAPEIDAAAEPAAAIDAGGETVAPPDPGDKLVIKSTPSGARVFLDGADEGKTPLTLNASSDQHSLAIVLPGHDLYLAEIDGKGTHNATLEAISPPEGPGGIKVRCKAEDRYYVYLDGKPTGQLCPTERLGVEKGEHQIEVYDLVSENRKSFTAKVKKTRVSVRVRIDYD